MSCWTSYMIRYERNWRHCYITLVLIAEYRHVLSRENVISVSCYSVTLTHGCLLFSSISITLHYSYTNTYKGTVSSIIICTECLCSPCKACVCENIQTVIPSRKGRTGGTTLSKLIFLAVGLHWDSIVKLQTENDWWYSMCNVYIFILCLSLPSTSYNFGS